MNILRGHSQTSSVRTVWLLTSLLLVASVPGAAEAPPEVRVETEAVPSTGDSFTVLWHLTPTQPWHICSDRLNDSGFPPSLKASWPEGWQAGDLQWPVAERYLMDGIILDHVYHGTVTLVQEVQVPTGAFAGGPVSVPVRWDWLACHGMCVPGKTEAAVVFDPGEDAGSANVDAALAQLPRPLPAETVAVSWEEGLVRFQAAGAASLEFHPAGDGQGVRYRDLPADGVAPGEDLTLRLRPGNEGFGHLRGTLMINHDDGSSDYWAVDIPYGGK